MKSNGLNFSAISKFRAEIMGLACLWVILHHFEGDIPFYPLDRLSVFGNAGVDIFLFLSGMGLYFAFQKKPPIFSFYKKRVVKLLIPYILICVPFYLWKFFCLGKGNLWLDLTQLSFPLERMITTWYVPAMFVFYIVFPLAYIILFNSKIKNQFVWLVGLSVTYLFGLLVFKNIFPSLYANTEIALTRFIIFLVGIYCGKAVFEKKPLPIEWVALSGALSIVCVLLRETTNLSSLWIRLSYGMIAFFVCTFAAYIFEFFKEKNPLLLVLQFFGKHSLEIYLTHVLLYNIWKNTLGVRFLDQSGTLDYMIVVVAAILISIPIHFLVTKISNLLVGK